MNVVLTFQVPAEIKERLEKLADATGRDRTVLAIEALGCCLQDQLRQAPEIQAGISESASGDFAAAAEMRSVQNKSSMRFAKSEMSPGPAVGFPSDDDELLDTAQMAALLGLSPITLQNWRSSKRYPLEYIKIGRNVRYRRSAAQKFLAARTVQ